MGWVFKGIDSSNEAAPIVSEYFTRKMLAKMGVQIHLDELDDFEITAFSFIQSEWNRLESAELKKKSRK